MTYVYIQKRVICEYNTRDELMNPRDSDRNNMVAAINFPSCNFLSANFPGGIKRLLCSSLYANQSFCFQTRPGGPEVNTRWHFARFFF